MKQWIFTNFVATRIAKLFGGIKGYKSQIGIGCTIIIQGLIYFAPIPVEYLKYLEQVQSIIIGATGISLGDKFRRNYEIGKAMIDNLENKIPVDPSTVP